jgi:hypothetical protein
METQNNNLVNDNNLGSTAPYEMEEFESVVGSITLWQQPQNLNSTGSKQWETVTNLHIF